MDLICLFPDVCGGLISEEETIIPLCNWVPKGMSLTEVANLVFASKNSYDTYANYAVYLVAQTLGLLFGGASNTSRLGISCQYFGMNGDGYDASDARCWKGLFDRVEQWYENRPVQMEPIFTVGTTGFSGKENPFPTVLYGNGMASKCGIAALTICYTDCPSIGEPTLPRFCLSPSPEETEVAGFI